MAGIAEVRQVDETHLHWRGTLDGVECEWIAEVTELRPHERIVWRATGGYANAGIVTFLQLDQQTTRITMSADVDDPDALTAIESACGATWSGSGNGRAQRALARPQGQHRDVVARRRDRSVAASSSAHRRLDRPARRRTRCGRELLRRPHVAGAPASVSPSVYSRSVSPLRSSADAVLEVGVFDEAEQRPRRADLLDDPSARTTSGSGWPPQATVTRARRATEVQVRAGDRAEAPTASPDCCWIIASLSQRRIARR